MGSSSKATLPGSTNNPFAMQRNKSPKFTVINRRIKGSQRNMSVSQEEQKAKRSKLEHEFKRRKNVNVVNDRRFGAGNEDRNVEEVMMERFVKERMRGMKQGGRSSKFDLDDEDDGFDMIGSGKKRKRNSASTSLTHKGSAITDETIKNDPFNNGDDSDNDDPYKALDKADTALHFGGGKLAKLNENPYGSYGGSGNNNTGNLGDMYRSRKTELDDVIKMSKMMKAEKAMKKEEQVSKFEEADEGFDELRGLLNFRDREKEKDEKSDRKKLIRKGEVEQDSDEEWDMEMRSYLFDKKAKATDRTKTPEELAKEEHSRLEELERKRINRMNWVFDGDDVSDVEMDSDVEEEGRRRKAEQLRGDDQLGDDDEEKGEGGKRGNIEMRFTADGLKYIDGDGNFVDPPEAAAVTGKVTGGGGSGDEESEDSDGEDEDSIAAGIGNSDDEASANDNDIVYPVGTRIKAAYRVEEQFQNKKSWYDGEIVAVNGDEEEGNVTYDVQYEDGDFEEGVKMENVKGANTKPSGGKAVDTATTSARSSSQKKETNDEVEVDEGALLKKKRQKAREIAQSSMPFIFTTPPTTLDALHDLIIEHCNVGSDVITLLNRIHSSNSVRLDRRNVTPMQNFLDVLIRRFVKVGDAIFESGDGGEMDRAMQIDETCKVIYNVSQDHPETAAAIFGRRLGITQRALSKRLRDAELYVNTDGTINKTNNNNRDVAADADEESDSFEDFSVFPSFGTIFMFRLIGHVFPVTDYKHAIVTPTLILMGQCLGQANVRKIWDVAKGLVICGIGLGFVTETKRVLPEVVGFVSGVIRLFSERKGSKTIKGGWKGGGGFEIPTLSGAEKSVHMKDIRSCVMKTEDLGKDDLLIDFNQGRKEVVTSVLNLALRLAGQILELYGTSSNVDLVKRLGLSVELLNQDPVGGKIMKKKIRQLYDKFSAVRDAAAAPRKPLFIVGPKINDLAVKSLHPKIEDVDTYKITKDKGKEKKKAERDKLQRQYKRESKAAARELRLDGQFIEQKRREEKNKTVNKGRDERNRNFAWMEGEAAILNQQVRQGGGLMSGGGVGAAKSKARTNKIGRIKKKDGKF